MQFISFCDSALEQGGTDDTTAGSGSPRNSPAIRRLGLLLKAHRYGEARDELARAELSEEITEFYVLHLRAILAMVEGSDHARDYLEMAAAVASSPHERAVLAEGRVAHDLLQGNPLAAAERCVATLDRVCQTEGLWGHLLIALSRLGEVETIDTTLRSFARLGDECTGRLVRLLLSDPDLREVRAMPAFRELLERHAAE